MEYVTAGELVRTITSDGLELTGYLSGGQSDIAVLHTHGTAGDFYTHKFIEAEAEKLASHDISFLSANNRGHDVFADIRKYSGKNVGWVQIGGAYEKFEESVFDIVAWTNFLKTRGIKKIILQGHSLGPNKNIFYHYKKHDSAVIAFIHLSPQNDAGLMLSKFGKEKYRDVNRMIHNLIAQGKGRDMLPEEFWAVCPVSAGAYAGYFIEDGTGNLFPYHNPDNPNWDILGNIRAPQLLLFGGMDPYIKPSVKRAAEIFKEHVKDPGLLRTEIIPGASHSYVGYEDRLMDIIMDWVKQFKRV